MMQPLECRSIFNSLIFVHFKRKEFACKDHCGFDKVNPELVWLCEVVRTIVGKPVIVLSGARCATHNQQVGGARNSQHLYGNAADLWVEHPTEVFQILNQLFPNIYGFGLYKNRIHVDCRHYKARWGMRAKMNVIVTGPARSGTHLASYWISKTTEREYVSETYFHPIWDKHGAQLIHYLKTKIGEKDNCVFQLPGVAHFIELFPECHVVYMMRNPADVLASQKRINWKDGQLRINLAPLFNICNTKFSPVEMLYMLWSWQKNKLPSHETWIYETLAETCDLFVPKEQRTDWKVSQVAPDIILNEEEYDNAFRDAREWKSKGSQTGQGIVCGVA